MNHRMRRIVETLACERRYGIADQKGAEYSGKGSTYKETGADTLNNFKSVAERIGGTPEQVLMTYLLKHVDSINTTVREAGVYTGQDENGYTDAARSQQHRIYAAGEGIVSRLDDARNYLDLLECLLIDNGHIEEAWDEEGMKYAEIGEGAADLKFPAMQPHQYPGAREAAVDRPAFAHHDILALTPEDGEWEGEGTREDPIRPKRTDTSVPTDEQYELMEKQKLEDAGLIECLDGVWRPGADKDESVKNPGERQVPIYMQPTMDQVRESLETGELDG